MSDNIVEITENTNYTLSIETNLEQNLNNVVVDLSNPSTLEIINNTTIFVGDLPQGYPLSWTIENLPISRVSGLIGADGITYNNGTIGISNIPYNLIPVHDIISGNGISINSNNGIYSIAVAGSFGLTIEEVDDRISSLLTAGNYINLNYNDISDSLTISCSGLQPSGNYSIVGHNHYSSDIVDFNNAVSGVSPVQSVAGRYGNVLLTKNDIGLNNVDNTSDSNKPISNATQTALNNKANVVHEHTSSQITDFNSAVSGLLPSSTFTSLVGVSGISVSNSGTNYTIGLTNPSIQLNNINDLSSNARNFLLTPSSNNLLNFVTDETGSGLLVFNSSPNFNGIPTVPTASSGTNNTQIANTQFVRTEISNLIGSAPSALDTLNELATALGNNPNFATTVTNSLSQKANLSGASFSGYISAPSAFFNNSLVVGVNEGSFNVNSAGSVNIPGGIGYFDQLKVNGIDVSISGHNHTSSNITNFNSSVSGLLPVTNLTAGSYIRILPSGTVFNISATGLQPSGNYSTVGHTHTSSNITDFNSSVSGLLPVTNIVGGTNINVSSSGSTYTVSVSGQLGLTSEEVDDRIASLLVAGSGISLSYDDPNNLLTISTTGLQPSGSYSLVGHSHTTSNITDFNTSVSGLVSSGVNTSLAAGSGISLEYYSNTDTLTIATSGISFVGHKHNANEINDFDSAVKLIKLNDLAVPTGVLNVNSQRIINVATAVSGTDAVNKNYIDTLVATTGTKGIASFDSADFNVINGVVSVKPSGIDNSQLLYSNIVLGSTTMNLGSTHLVLSGVTIDGGSP